MCLKRRLIKLIELQVIHGEALDLRKALSSLRRLKLN